MATYTDNLNLKKPDETDFVDINDINKNMDAIDDAVSLSEQKIAKLKDDVGNIAGTCYGFCDKDVNSDNMVVSIINGNFSLTKGATIDVLFKNDLYLQIPEKATLNVDNTGAKKVHISSYNYLYSGAWKHGSVIRFVYTGESWRAELPFRADTDNMGVTYLCNDIGPYPTVAATPYCVKKAYDLADTANQKAKQTEKAVNENTIKLEELSNSVNEKFNGVLSGNNITTEITSTIDGYIGYEGYDDILGLQVDYENKIFTRLAGAVDKTAGEDFNNFAMYGGRKRCTVAKDGTIKAFCGDTNYSDVGSSQDGQIMVYQPKFYYKVVPLKMDKITDGLGYHIRKANYYITDTPKAGFKLHPAFYDENGKEIDYILYSAYESAYWDSSLNVWFKDGTMTDTNMDYTRDSLWSLSSKKPISGAVKNLTKDNFELLAHNLGSGWHLETIKAVAANQLLMMIEFGTMNFQDAIGKGVVAFSSNATYNASSLTGSTKDLGNATGQAAKTINEIAGVETEYTEDGKTAVSYRGMENPWGNLYRLVNGLNIWGDGSMLGGQPYVADDYEFNASKHTDNYKPVGFVLPNGTGYISAMGYGSEEYDWLLMPSENKGNSSLPVGDYSDITSNVNDYRAIMHFGAWSNNLAAGVFDCICLYGPNSKSRTLGGRLVYIPTAE